MQKFDFRGVSEALGFILILMIVLLSISTVTLYGYPMLLKQQISTDLRNMDQNMVVLQNDMIGIAYRSVPYSETTMKIGSGVLNIIPSGDGGSSFTISTDAGYNSGAIQPGLFLFRSDDNTQEIAIENGAVIERHPQYTGSVMLSRPRCFYDADTSTLVINIITIDANERTSANGITTVQTEILPASPTTITEESLTDTVTITFTKDNDRDYSTAWGHYLTEYLGMTETAADTYTKTGVTRLIVRQTTINTGII